MKQGAKRTSEHLEMPTIKKTQSTRKNDIFGEFQDNRQIFKKDNNNLSNNKMMFKTKQKQRLASEDGDYYNDDFDEIQNSQSAKVNRKSELPAIGNQKKKQKIQQSQQKLTGQTSNDQKLGSRHRNTRSEMNNSRNNANKNQAIDLGRYEAEVDRKFGNISAESLGNQAISKSNQQIRDLIKRYNEILTDLINRNLVELTNKKRKKPATAEQSMKVLQQEIKNNTKIEQLDLAQLKKLQEYKDRLEEQQNYSEKTMEEQIMETHALIKQIRKQIYNKKLAVQNQAKKLVPTNIIASKNQSQSQVTILKQKLLTIKKQWQKNQEKLNSLTDRQKQLISKIDNLGDIDKEADELRTSAKKTQDKSKKYQQVKKRHEAVKGHTQKIQALWTTKCNVNAHENQSIRTKVKNMDLQVKNVEQSSKMAYQKSTKFLNTVKPKNQAQQKAIEKIISQMNTYSEQNVQVQRQMSLSQMKMMSKKKNSVDQSNNKELQEKATTEQNTKKQSQIKKPLEQQNQKNRIWKQQTQNLKNDQGQKDTTNTSQLKNSKTERNTLKPFKKLMTEENKADEKQYESLPIKKQQKQQTEVQAQKQENKPKKFNFNRNKANSQLETVKENEVTENQSKNDLKQSKTGQLQLKINQQIKKVENTEPISNKIQKEKIEIAEQQQIKPKRFNLNLKDRKQKQQNSGYQPSSEQNNSANNAAQKQAQQNRQLSKPTFNLKRNRESQAKQRLSLDNQFMKE